MFVDGHWWTKRAEQMKPNEHMTTMLDEIGTNVRWNDNGCQMEQQRTLDGMTTNVGWNKDERQMERQQTLNKMAKQNG